MRSWAHRHPFGIAAIYFAITCLTFGRVVEMHPKTDENAAFAMMCGAWWPLYWGLELGRLPFKQTARD